MSYCTLRMNIKLVKITQKVQAKERKIKFPLTSLTGSSGEFLIPGLLRLDIECPGLPGLSLNMSSRNSIGGGTDGTANDCLNTPRN